MAPKLSRRRFLAGCGIAGTTALAAGASAGGTDGGRPKDGGRPGDGRTPPPETRWSRTYGTGSNGGVTQVLPTADDGFVAVGSTVVDDAERVWLFEVGPAGELAWERTYAEGPTAVGNGIASTGDGFVIAGYTADESGGNRSGLVIRVAPEGTEEWRETLSLGRDTSDHFEGVAHDGGEFAFVGKTDEFDSAWAVVMDESGTTAVNDRYSKGGRNHFYEVIPHSSGGYVAVGHTDNSRSDLHGWVTKIDSDGTTAWSEAYTRQNEDRYDSTDDFNAFYDVTETTNGFVAVGGNATAEGDGERRGWIMEVNSSGGDQWNTAISDGAFTEFYGVAREGLAYVAAGISAADESGSGANGVSARFGIEGNPQWSARYSSDGASSFADIHATDEGGLVHFGSTGIQSTSRGWGLKLGGQQFTTPSPTPSPTPTDRSTSTPTGTPTQSSTASPTPTDTPSTGRPRRRARPRARRRPGR